DSAAMPFLYDFYLSATTSASRPHSPALQLQERGLTPPTHPSELKYCILRPQRTDRTAIPITNTLGPNTDLDFIPALALVAANYPARWIWWGTEALQMVVFGRQLKNVIMEWKWKQGRTRIGGPILHRLIGCSFRVAPDRRYCWRVGSGKRRIHVDATDSQSRTAGNAEGNSGGNGGGSSITTARRHQGRELALPGRTDLSRTAAGGGWFNSFFTRTNNASAAESRPGDVPLNDVRTPSSPLPHMAGAETEGAMSEPSQVSTGVDGIPLSVQEATADGTGEVDEELGCYHCREENRSATSRRLEIYAEVGDRCETAMMLMCTRLDDLFMSIPEEKKNGVFVSNNGGSEAVAGSGSPVGRRDSPDEGAERNNIGRENGENVGVATRTEDWMLASDQRSEISVLKRLFAGRYTWRAWLKWTVAAILITLSSLYHVLGAKAPLGDLHATIEKTRLQLGIPGLSVAVLYKGEIIFAEGFGKRNAQGDEYKASTLQPIGSVTKSFTAAAIGEMVAEGKLDWDTTPVNKYLPEFQYKDPVLTSQLTFIDLLSHRT
ncbi:hypothetical protein BGZ70_004591, partial [Mortierella alpina]